jgi:integrase
MMPQKVPKLCRHRGSGRAYVTDPATGRQITLGPWGAPETDVAYGRWVQEFLARPAGVPSPHRAGLVVSQIGEAYLDFARGYYRKHGKVTSEVNTVEQILRVVLELYADLPANSFGPSQFRTVRDALVQRNYARKHINRQMARVCRIWKWGVEHELVRPEALTALQAVAPLARGRTPAKDRPPILPVPWNDVEATLPFLRADRFRVMVRVHFLSGCRPGDVVLMRPCDIDRSRPVWVYTPWTHKTEHHGRDRKIFLGPKCQDLLAPLLGLTSPQGWVFPSIGYVRQKGKGPGHLTQNGYRQIIESAVNRANKSRQRAASAAGAKKAVELPHWFPLQIRHAALTEVRRRFGLEAAQVMGGHATADVTQIYAERDQSLAERVASEIG